MGNYNSHNYTLTHYGNNGMRYASLHRWDISIQEAKELQSRLRRQLRRKPLPKDADTIAGVDMAIDREKENFIAAAVVMKLPECRVLEVKIGKAPTVWPYIPGLLSFREAPAILRAFEQLQSIPEAIIFDGQGSAHPRRFGLAAHLGLWLSLPTVGCAKNCLTGCYREPGVEKSAFQYLYDNDEIIGAAVRTRKKVKPVFVSPGHLADLHSSIELVLRCANKYRLPEPVRQAHIEAEKAKQ